jgi:hypothetical protein
MPADERHFGQRLKNTAPGRSSLRIDRADSASPLATQPTRPPFSDFSFRMAIPACPS